MENTATLGDTIDAQTATLGGSARSLIDSPEFSALGISADRAQVAARASWRMMAADLSVFALLGIAWAVVGTWFGAGGSGSALMALSGALLVAFSVFGLYSTAQRPDPLLREEARQCGTALLVAGFAWMALVSFTAGTVDGGVVAIAIAWMATVFLVGLPVRRVVRERVLAADPERVLIIGAGEIGQQVALHIRDQVRSPLTVVGLFDDDPLPLREELAGLRVHGGMESLTDVIAHTRASRIIIAFTRQSAHEVLERIRDSRHSAIPISVVPRYFEITPSHANVSEVGGVPVVDLSSARLSRGAAATKRAMDLAGASLGVVLLSPLLLAVAVAIKLTSRGPVFFRQERTGHNGRVFRIWKFRTMRVDAEALREELSEFSDMVDGGPLFKMHNDPRVTSIGRVLRRLSIDELPQLFNVIGGSMSLVGPRPFVVKEAEQMRGWSRRRLDLVPGMTGLWQISGRNDLSYEEMIRLDYLYVTNWSPWWDLRILIETVPRVLTGRGAS